MIPEADRLLRQLRAVVQIGMARPQVEPRLRFVEQLETERRQALRHAAVRIGQPFAQRLQVLAPAALGQRVAGDALGEAGRGQSGHHLQLRQVVHQRRRGDEVADPDVRRDRLREAADVDDPLQLIEARQRRARLRIEVDVDVVLDQRDIVVTPWNGRAISGSTSGTY